MIENLRRGNIAEAAAFSQALTGIFNEVVALTAKIPSGNPFTSANKAMDHFFAHGPGAGRVAPPRLHSKERLSTEMIDAVGAALARHGLMPAKGYLR